MIPVHDVNPTRRTPWVTYLLIALNLIVFLLSPAASTSGVRDVSLGEPASRSACSSPCR